MNTSSLYTAAIKTQLALKERLENINSYLTEGKAETTVIFYGTRKQIVSKKTYTSKWTTSIGKDRVTTMHLNWIDYLTRWNVPNGTVSIKVISPFVTSNKTTVATKVPMSIPLETMKI
jgi:hypothetical protein